MELQAIFTSEFLQILFQGDDSMASHLHALNSLCRLCGCRPNSRSQLIPNEKHGRDIHKFLGIDISHDDELIHARSICDLCRRKLDRSSNLARKQRKAKLPPTNITLLAFVPHASNSCSICRPVEWDEGHLQFCRDNGFHSCVSSQKQVVGVTVSDGSGVIIKRIVIGTSTFETYVLGKEVKLKHENPCDAIKELPTAEICVGNFEFQNVARQYKEEGLKGSRGQTVAIVEQLDMGNELSGLQTDM
ncbi:hypothetical protein HOLleu_02110 [Holothuria leucospilota]|uniref:ZAD domain-containing protein n=1 Tax=Holothuria leucospilota TaxID=206669 RepID=A0A9Q1CQ78_HOLLE|nr:hypothetical protein HOLleu_02110 [Holothuria leucospilota]